MKLLLENWRKYLTEVSFDDAKDILDSKRTLKIIKAYRYEKGQDDTDGNREATMIAGTQHRNFKNSLFDQIPDDLTDNQKGTSVLWLLKISRENPKVAAMFIENRLLIGPRRSLETFFHHQRFMPKQDLMQIKTLDDLIAMTHSAKEEIRKEQEKKNYLDAEQGTEILSGRYEYNEETEKLERVPGGNGWFIAAIHNKGAACELGRYTDWCTAAPGLDYFGEYYKEDDPLFYFQNKTNSNKFQFHYGSSQFMNSEDERVDKETFEVLHNLLIQTEAYNKYEKLRIFELERLVKIRLVDGPHAEAQIDEMRELLNSLEDPYSMANSLAEMATLEHFNIATYILRWLSSEEFYKYTGVARRIVKYHDIVPSDILEDLAENNPHGRTRVMAREALERRARVEKRSSDSPSHKDV